MKIENYLIDRNNNSGRALPDKKGIYILHNCKRDNFYIGMTTGKKGIRCRVLAGHVKNHSYRDSAGILECTKYDDMIEVITIIGLGVKQIKGFESRLINKYYPKLRGRLMNSVGGQSDYSKYVTDEMFQIATKKIDKYLFQNTNEYSTKNIKCFKGTVVAENKNEWIKRFQSSNSVVNFHNIGEINTKYSIPEFTKNFLKINDKGQIVLSRDLNIVSDDHVEAIRRLGEVIRGKVLEKSVNKGITYLAPYENSFVYCN